MIYRTNQIVDVCIIANILIFVNIISLISFFYFIFLAQYYFNCIYFLIFLKYSVFFKCGCKSHPIAYCSAQLKQDPPDSGKGWHTLLSGMPPAHLLMCQADIRNPLRIEFYLTRLKLIRQPSRMIWRSSDVISPSPRVNGTSAPSFTTNAGICVWLCSTASSIPGTNR